MPATRPIRKALWLALVLTVSAGTLGSGAAGRQTLDGYDRFVRGDGTFRFSPEVTAGMVHLGSWFVPSGEAPGFHHVYTQADAIARYRDTGAFPDGTALVKEISHYRRADYTTGADVAFATESKQWFLMVKDAEGRFDGNALWGNGWGWALFKSGEPTRNVATDFRQDCLGCHVPAHQSDWVYVEGYPTLHER